MPPYALDKSEIQRLIEAEAQRQGLNPALVEAVIRQESNFDPQARSPKGAIGLMQLMPATARGLGVDPYDVQDNLRGGVRYLKQQQKRFGSTEKALAAYNAGPGAVEKYGGVPPYKETQGYVKRIMGFLGPASAEAATGDALPDLPARPPQARAAPVSAMAELPDLPERPGAAPEVAPAAETFPPLAEQEAAATQQALYGQAPGQPPALETPEATMRKIPAPQEPQGPPAPKQPSVSAPPTTPPASQAPSLLSRLGQAADTASRGTLGGQIYPLVQPILQAQYGEHLEKLPQAGAAGAISATGAMLGTAAGNYVVPGAGGLLGEMAGSYLARQLNVGLGLEEPGLQGDVASVAVPPVVRGATRVLGPLVTRGAKAVTRRLPGAATAMHEDIAARLHTTEGTIRPEHPVADYYREAARYNPNIAPNRLHTTSSEILRQEMRLPPATRNQELARIAEDMRDLSAQGTISLEDFYANQQRIGEIVDNWRDRGGTGARDIRRLYAAFHDDMERAAARGVPGAQELRTAIGASRAEQTANEFQRLFRPGSGGITVDPEGRLQFHGGKLRTRWNNMLHDDPVFAGGITPQVRNEVDDIIMQAQRLERLRPPRGAQYGSGRRLASVVLGGAVAGPIGSAILLEAPNLIAQAMGTQRGRAAVRWALQQGGGRINADDLAIIAALVRPTVQDAAAPPASETGGAGP